MLTLIPHTVLMTVETILACVAFSFAVSLFVGCVFRSAGASPSARAASTYRLAAGAALRRPGERYIGSLTGDAGQITHLYLTAGSFRGDWRTACAWAGRQGGDLPTVDELLLIRILARDALTDGEYWTNETPGAHPAWAMYVNAYTGRVGDEHISAKLIAIAVRRVKV